MSDSKGKLRHIPAHVLGMDREEEQVAPQRGLPIGASLRSRTFRQLFPGLLLAVSRSQCRVNHAGQESVVFLSSPWPQRHLPPSRSSWPYLPGAGLSLWRAGPDTQLPGCCLISTLINHLSLAFLAAAKFCFDARAIALPQLGREQRGTCSITSSMSG